MKIIQVLCSLLAFFSISSAVACGGGYVILNNDTVLISEQVTSGKDQISVEELQDLLSKQNVAIGLSDKKKTTTHRILKVAIQYTFKPKNAHANWKPEILWTDYTIQTLVRTPEAATLNLAEIETIRVKSNVEQAADGSIDHSKGVLIILDGAKSSTYHEEFSTELHSNIKVFGC